MKSFNIFSKRRCRSIRIACLGLCFVFGAGSAVRAGNPSGAMGTLAELTGPTPMASRVHGGPFETRALHLQCDVFTRSPDQERQLIRQIALRGYNALIVMLGSTRRSVIRLPAPGKVKLRGESTGRMREWITHARQSGIEPIIEIKCIGKQAPMLEELAKKYPDLLVHDDQDNSQSVLNPAFRFPDGRDPYEALFFPLIDEVVSWYGAQPPRYLLLGVDEVSVNALAKVAGRTGRTVAQIYATALNRCAEHLLAQGVTPVIWGDMLLSKRLASPGVAPGFAGDPRFTRSGTAYHAEYRADAGRQSVVSAINLIQRRRDIIVADWHYFPHFDGQYPSMDYFQAMGFKAVWGAVFSNEKALQQFTRYAARRHASGMIATTWYLSMMDRAIFPPTVNNSILYFLKPDLQPPHPLITSYQVRERKYEPQRPKSSAVTVISHSAAGVAILADTPAPVHVENSQIWLEDASSGRVILGRRSPAAPAKISARVELDPDPSPTPRLFNLWIRYRDAATGYLAQTEYPGAVVKLGDSPLITAGDASDGSLFEVDFSKLDGIKGNPGMILASGKFSAAMLLRGLKQQSDEAAGPLSGGALDCTALDAAYGFAPKGLWEHISQKGMHLVVVAKMTGQLQRNPWCDLVSFGSFREGFRLLLGRDGTLMMQFAKTLDGANPVRITPAQTVKPGQWMRVDVQLSPPDEKGRRRATVKVNDGKPVAAVLQRPLVEPDKRVPIGLGVEFPMRNQQYKRWPNFPGLIRTMKIMPFKHRGDQR